MSRPFFNHGIDELEALVRKAPVDRETLRTLKAELSLRRRARERAQLLVVEIDRKLQGVTQQSKEEDVKSPSSACAGSGTEVDRDESDPVGQEQEEELFRLRRENAVLRAGISSRAEILERWGLAVSAPPSLIAVVADYWRSHLGNRVDGRGRSARRLSDELQPLVHESEGVR